jgi:hypothetical protein
MTRVTSSFSGIVLGVRPILVVPMAASTQRTRYPRAATIYRFTV